MKATDEDIQKALKRNPEAGFRLLVDRFERPIYWYVRRMVVAHEDAQDIVQEIFVRVFRGWEKFQGKSQISTWVYRIATNETLRFLERERNGTVSLDSVTEQGFDAMADDYVDYSDLEVVKLQKAIHSLPPKQQAAFNMRYYDEMDYAQIAEVTESAETSVRVNYHMAKQKIIDFMNKIN